MAEGKKKIEIGDIIHCLYRRLLAIIAIALICGIGTWIVNTTLIKPQYKTSVSLYVYSSLDRTNESISTITLSELDASQSLVDTYIVILKSNTVLKQVIEELELKIEPSELAEQISASSVNGTEVLSISVCDKNPETAQEIANTIARILPDELIRVVKAGGVEVVDYAELPTIPSSPNVILNTMAGFLFGLCFSCGVFLVYDFSSRKIIGEEELAAYFDISVIGVIPKLDIAEEEQDAKKNRQ